MWQDKLEKKRVFYVERMRNELAYAHKKVEEKKEKEKGNKMRYLLKVEEATTNYQIHGGFPKWNKWLQCCDT